MDENKGLTGAEAGLSGDDQIKIALREIVAQGGSASIEKIYAAVEHLMSGKNLSQQGKASLRFFVNNVAVKAGFIYPHDKTNPGWKITPEGRAFLEAENQPEEENVEETTNVDTNQSVPQKSNSARGTAFELYILELLKKQFPEYAWYHQGIHKSRERGLDLIGTLIGNDPNTPKVIGVQVKFHAEKTAPSQTEWLKFLAGCFARRIDKALFVTTGSLTSEQRREAGESEIVVIEGRQEVDRIAERLKIEHFSLYDESTQSE